MIIPEKCLNRQSIFKLRDFDYEKNEKCAARIVITRAIIEKWYKILKQEVSD